MSYRRGLSGCSILIVATVAQIILYLSTNAYALISPLVKPVSIFSSSADKVQTVESLKSQILQLGASLDRGQAYNPTSGSYYADRMDVARLVMKSFTFYWCYQCWNDAEMREWRILTIPSAFCFRLKIESLNALAPSVPTSLEDIAGEWELVLSTVPHGIFRSSPFFLAIQEAFAAGGEPEKANLFFKLHELQVMSWGASKIGRVAQVYLGLFFTWVFNSA